MPNSKPNCATRKPRWLILPALLAVALLCAACSTTLVPAPPQRVCSLSQPQAELMQSLPAGSLSAGFLAFDDELVAAIKARQLSIEQVIALQHMAAAYIASQGDAANDRLIALQDYVTRALKRCAPDG